MADNCHKYRFKGIFLAEREARRFGSRNESGTGLPEGPGLVWIIIFIYLLNLCTVLTNNEGSGADEWIITAVSDY